MPTKSFPVDVSPPVLRWARESAGYSISDVAERVRESEKQAAAWESGKERPSWTVLRKLAKLYQRPVAALLLETPPEEAPPPPDFRTLPRTKRDLSPSTRFAIRTAKWLVQTAAEVETLLGADRSFEAFNGKVHEDPEILAREQRARLGVSLKQQTGWRGAYEAFRQWRAAVEAKHIFVFQFGLPVEEVRGFSFFEEGRPAIVVNQADTINARIFTLFHEYGHLLSSQPGICLPQEGAVIDSQKLETFCNRFAAALLIPRGDFEGGLHNIPWEKAFSFFARRYRVSRYVVLGRMHTIGRVSSKTYAEMTKRWQASEQVAPARIGPQKGGRSMVTIRLQERGHLFSSLVIDALRREAISANDATSYLGIQLKHLDRIAAAIR